MNTDTKEVLEEKINQIKTRKYESHQTGTLNSYVIRTLSIRYEYKCIYYWLRNSGERQAAVKYFVEEVLSVSLAGAASCLNHLDVIEKADMAIIQEIGSPVFDKIKMLYAETWEKWGNINPYELWELLLAMLYCYRYDAEIAVYLPEYLQRLAAMDKDKLRKELIAWRQRPEKDMVDTLDIPILREDENVDIELLSDIKGALTDELLSIQKEYLKEEFEYKDILAERFWQYIEYIRQERPKAMQKLLFIDEFLQKLCEEKGSEEAAFAYVLSSKKPERYLFSYYVKINEAINGKQEEKALQYWWEELYVKYKSVICEPAKCWASWFYVIKSLLLYLEKGDVDETFFLTLMKERINKIPAYDYRADYLKKLLVFFSDLFCHVYQNNWDCKAVCELLGENNLFKYSNDAYINGWIKELYGIERKEFHEKAAKAFVENNRDKSPEDIVWLYMNTNLRFIYDIRDLLYMLSERLEESSVYKNAEFWEYVRVNPVAFKYNELGEKIRKIKDVDAFAKANDKDERILDVFAKKYIEYLFSEYRLDASVVNIDQKHRARDKVEIAFAKIHTGFQVSGNRVSRNEKTVYCDEEWVQENRKAVFTWGRSACTCKICGYDKVHKKIYVDSVQDINPERVLNVEEEMKKLLSWMEQIRQDKNVYDPYYLLGNDGAKYKKLFGSDMKEKYRSAWLFPDKPDENMSAVFAHAIFDTMCCLERTPDEKAEENAPKLIKFLRQLNYGSMDSINEYKYTVGAKNNAGPGEWDDEIKDYVLKPANPELQNSAVHDLEKLCSLKGFSLTDKSNIYMNTYLKQYIPLQQFWDKIKGQGWKEQRYLGEFFISTEDSEKDEDGFYFCLKYVGEYNESGVRGAEFQLYPYNKLWAEPEAEAWQGYRWVYKFWKTKSKEFKKVKSKEDACWGSVFRIDTDNRIIYLSDLRTRDGSKEPWYNFNLKMRDLPKINKGDKEGLRKQVKAILGILKDVEDKERFYCHGDRMIKITDYLKKCLEKYEYDIESMEIVLGVFADYNPYREIANGRSNSKIEQMKKNLLSDQFIKKTDSCMKKYLQIYSSEKHALSSYLAVYRNSFLCLSKEISEDTFIKGIQEKTGYSEKDIRSKM